MDSMSHHHHHAGHGHPPRSASPSLLRMSAVERLAAAIAVAGALWIATWWVVSGS
jgi:hypothetical protein